MAEIIKNNTGIITIITGDKDVILDYDKHGIYAIEFDSQKSLDEILSDKLIIEHIGNITGDSIDVILDWLEE